MGSENPSDLSTLAHFHSLKDTTTLGGAGFASQLNPTGFPWKVDAETYRGLAIRFRRPPSASLTPGSEGKVPGGGKAPVSVYCLQLKMTVPEDRPDGRRESAVTYEWDFDAYTAGETNPRDPGVLHAQADWSEFKATYRGRPKDDAEPLDLAKVKEWSIMARSNFGVSRSAFRGCLMETNKLQPSAITVAVRAVLPANRLSLRRAHRNHCFDRFL